MSTVLDEFIIKLGLDPKNFDANQKKTTENFGKFVDKAVKGGKRVEESTTSMADGFSSVTRKALAFYGLLVGASTVKDFVVDQTTAGAAVGRTAGVLGMSVTALSTWRNAAILAGGSAASMSDMIGGLVKEFNSMEFVTGQSDMIKFLNNLHVSIADPRTGKIKDMTQFLLELADSTKGVDKQFAATQLRGLHIPEELLPMFLKGRSAVQAYLDTAQKLGPLTEKDTDAFIALQSAFNKAQLGSESFSRSLLTGLIPSLVEVLDKMSGLKTPNNPPGVLTYFAAAERDRQEALRTDGKSGDLWALWELLLGLKLPTLDGAAPGGGGGQRVVAPPPIVRLRTLRTKSGKTFDVNEKYAAQFEGFVAELESIGYKIDSIGGYNDRNVAGTNIPSFHSQGASLDLNPARNPVGPSNTNNLPSNISDIAHRHGLGWGGDWHSKKDPMHFSVATDEGGTIQLARVHPAKVIAAGTTLPRAPAVHHGPSKPYLDTVSPRFADALSTVNTKVTNVNVAAIVVHNPKDAKEVARNVHGALQRSMNAPHANTGQN